MNTALPGDGSARANFHVGNAEDLVEGLRGPYTLILVDSSASAAVGGLGTLSRRFRELLWSRLDPTGTLVVGPVAPAEHVFDPPAGWTWVRYHRTVVDAVEALEMHIPADETLSVAWRDGARTLPAEMDGFVRDGEDAS
jgi:hypothetical protein